MTGFRKTPATPERVNVARPTEGRVVVNPSTPPPLTPAARADLPRSYERMNDLLGEPGDKALQWRDLGDYLYGQGLNSVSDATCRALAFQTTETTLDVARFTHLASAKRGVFRFENLPWCRYRALILGSDTGYSYPANLDMHLPLWGGRGTFAAFNSANFNWPGQFDIPYTEDPETLSAELLDPARKRFDRWSFPFQTENPVMMPERLTNTDGTRRDVVVYESDRNNVASVEIFPINSQLVNFYTPADVRVSCLLRQTAGPALGASSGVTLTLRGWNDSASATGRTVQDLGSLTVPFDSGGRGYVSFGNADPFFISLQLAAPVLVFGEGIANGTRIEIHHVTMNTTTLRRLG